MHQQTKLQHLITRYLLECIAHHKLIISNGVRGWSFPLNNHSVFLKKKKKAKDPWPKHLVLTGFDKWRPPYQHFQNIWNLLLRVYTPPCYPPHPFLLQLSCPLGSPPSGSKLKHTKRLTLLYKMKKEDGVYPTTLCLWWASGFISGIYELPQDCGREAGGMRERGERRTGRDSITSEWCHSGSGVLRLRRRRWFIRPLKAVVSQDVGWFGNLIWEGLSMSLVITYTLPESLKIISIM